MKTCTKCKQEKPYSDFYKAPPKQRSGDGYLSRCKKCLWESKKERMAKWPNGRRKEYSRQQQKHARKWDDKHPHGKKAYSANLHARRVGAQGVLSEQDVADCWEQWGGKCWVCGRKATELDHFRPINSGAGGTNTTDNIRPICRECNHKRDHGWHGNKVAEKEAVLLKQISKLLHDSK